MSELVLSRAQVRAVDRIAIERFGVPGLVLMENAGLLATLALLEGGAPPGPIAVLCGGGNNGGDGYVIARQLANRGLDVRVYATTSDLRGDAAVNRAIVGAMGLEVVDLRAEGALAGASSAWDEAAVCVDALLGTGFEGHVRAPLAGVIEALNRATTTRVAIDLPSGLDADTGRPSNATVVAERTLTFVARKLGFDAPGAARYTGAVTVLPIGAPAGALRAALLEES